MVAEIKGTGPQNVSAVDTGLRKVGGPSAVAATEPAKTSDVVTLTDLASRLQTLTDSVAQLPEVDQKRVAELKSAIENGDYRIDDTKIADKLTAFETQLGRGGQVR
jgi:negative regulator of flagellin synthesis FlgM